jgi:hypothetical protein
LHTFSFTLSRSSASLFSHLRSSSCCLQFVRTCCLQNKLRLEAKLPVENYDPGHTGRVVVLTRDAHRNGRWVTSLVTSLEQRLQKGAIVEVLSVEHVSNDDSLLPSSSAPQLALLVNRVSDAAPPTTAKKTTAMLSILELHGIPVINGTKCFGIGNNKVLHHQVLSRAGVVILSRFSAT